MIEKSLLTLMLLATMVSILFMAFISIEAGFVLGTVGILLAFIGVVWQ